MNLTVEKYDQQGDYYTCRDPSGKLRRVDLIVDGGLRGTPAYDESSVAHWQDRRD